MARVPLFTKLLEFLDVRGRGRREVLTHEIYSRQVNGEFDWAIIW
uniref:Uncharacterized protein n=1 Tax=Rhizophora mucronata TaxID=61149 RepID=A0A2P2N2M2_RHIMU